MIDYDNIVPLIKGKIKSNGDPLETFIRYRAQSLMTKAGQRAEVPTYEEALKIIERYENERLAS